MQKELKKDLMKKLKKVNLKNKIITIADGQMTIFNIIKEKKSNV